MLRIQNDPTPETYFVSGVYVESGPITTSVGTGSGSASPPPPVSSASSSVASPSTVATAEAVALAGRLAAQDVRFLDAPVSGMPARAIDGTLTVMCGGDPASFAAVRPLLECIGAHILHMGPTGSGQLTKTVNNVIYDINIAALAEVLPMAQRYFLF